MFENITESVSQIFVGNLKLIVFFLSMIPFIGSIIGIPFVLNSNLWFDNVLTPIQAIFYSFIPMIIISIILPLMLRPLFNYIEKKKPLNSPSEIPLIKRMLFIILLTALPLPFCDIYVGIILSMIIKLNFSDMLISNLIGNLVSCILLTFFSILNHLKIIIYIITGIIFVGLLLLLFDIYFKAKKTKKNIN